MLCQGLVTSNQGSRGTFRYQADTQGFKVNTMSSFRWHRLIYFATETGLDENGVWHVCLCHRLKKLVSTWSKSTSSHKVNYIRWRRLKKILHCPRIKFVKKKTSPSISSLNDSLSLLSVTAGAATEFSLVLRCYVALTSYSRQPIFPFVTWNGGSGVDSKSRGQDKLSSDEKVYLTHLIFTLLVAAHQTVRICLPFISVCCRLNSESDGANSQVSQTPKYPLARICVHRCLSFHLLHTNCTSAKIPKASF